MKILGIKALAVMQLSMRIDEIHDAGNGFIGLVEKFREEKITIYALKRKFKKELMPKDEIRAVCNMSEDGKVGLNTFSIYQVERGGGAGSIARPIYDNFANL